MVYSANHGGDCCGINHAVEFPTNRDGMDRAIQRLQQLISDSKPKKEYEYGEVFYVIPHYGNDPSATDAAGCLAIEICLTDQQCSANDSFYPQEFKKLGFKHTARWLNCNSGNYVNQFVWHKKATTKKPWKW